MKLIITKTYEEMSEIASNILLGYILSPENQNIAITGGRTPALMYEKLVTKMSGLNISYNTTFYNFDEIAYKRSKREGITISDLRSYFFTPANIPEENIHRLDETNYKAHDHLIQSRGGMDFILLGVGADGHFCGNLPNTTQFFDQTTQVVMSDAMRQNVGEFHFSDPQEYPDTYVTMGPRSVMNTKNILLIANGKEKADIIKRILGGPVDPLVPASILPLHPKITILIDSEAASELDEITINQYK
ncbi:hypothetical protein AOC36_11295 [Erysipelothrix larvae]|uniref:Glucosamine/galactosamine-6-phosphate isomerase domain-containing protein n=1 Tax=Erysipelothrix larvae TaxID=1514105 RepID=A0A0X8H1Y5_9FIRM|nr:glucosamine-6-phosphate deaminase [Erysipelothrix larvae]AMC94535.1 hypothetical protein AOC36_11295 [Erysipelothrix larvae]